MWEFFDKNTIDNQKEIIINILSQRYDNLFFKTSNHKKTKYFSQKQNFI